ncbi:MAG: hypothetical protein J2P33_16115 [Actinobacteria bacterium]|nr:hypothetical protein [Actinomycetota bacterium]
MVLPALGLAAVLAGGLAVTAAPAGAQVRSPAAPAAVKARLIFKRCQEVGSDRLSTDPIYNDAIQCAYLWFIPGTAPTAPTFYAQNEVYCRHINGNTDTFPPCGAITTQAQLAWKIGTGATTVHGSGTGMCGQGHPPCPAHAVFHATTPVRFRPFRQQVWAVSHDLVKLPGSGKIVSRNVATPHATAATLG